MAQLYNRHAKITLFTWRTIFLSEKPRFKRDSWHCTTKPVPSSLSLNKENGLNNNSPFSEIILNHCIDSIGLTIFPIYIGTMTIKIFVFDVFYDTSLGDNVLFFFEECSLYGWYWRYTRLINQIIFNGFRCISSQISLSLHQPLVKRDNNLLILSHYRYIYNIPRS